MQNSTVQSLIYQFDLLPHPEGGYYKETYRSNEWIGSDALPERFSGNRAFSTAIYFLLEKGNYSAFHKIKSDECWHFYAGDTLDVYIIQADGQIEIIHLGNKITMGETFQYVVPANCWFASVPAEKSDYCFVGCTVAPGFDFADFELGKVEDLIALYPQHATVLEKLCR